jgi:hypothetical protein
MGLAGGEGLLERPTKLFGSDLADAREERDVREILHARVGTLARQRVGVKLLRDVGLQRVEAQGRGLEPPLRMTLSPSSRTIRARKRSKTRS